MSSSKTGKIDITMLSRENLILLLRKSGATAADDERLKAQFDDGAPQNEDGTINLLEYAAWLIAAYHNV